MGKQAKLKRVKREVAEVLLSYDFAVHEVHYSSDNSYAVICGIEQSGTPRVSVVAPGGMPVEKMHHISSIALNEFKRAIDRVLINNAQQTSLPQKLGANILSS